MSMPRKKKIFRGVTLSGEFRQLLNHRSFDIDDLIYNTAGAFPQIMKFCFLRTQLSSAEMIQLLSAELFDRFLSAEQRIQKTAELNHVREF